MKLEIIQNSDCICVGSENFFVTIWLENNMWLVTFDGFKDDPLFFVTFKRALDHVESALQKLEIELEQEEMDVHYALLMHDTTDDWKDGRLN